MTNNSNITIVSKKTIKDRLQKAADEFPVITDNPKELLQMAADRIRELETVVDAGVDWYAAQSNTHVSGMYSAFAAKGKFYSLAVLAGHKATKKEPDTAEVYHFKKEEDKDE